MMNQRKDDMPIIQTKMDLESFERYSKKYKISKDLRKLMLKALGEQNPEFKQFEPQYSWQKEGNWGYEFKVDEKKVVIELGNWPSLNNVTFVGMEGVNI